ncbi:serine/threonine-protein kinase PCRK1-like [Telopea speciosissima]|uniref:serine/threonine-protein kinase PCRK1-like n=1 Tax=Telopea speciosissima TaxID=54955 RepID=UPI001CC58720|nr:serine/threonine-protein kinase PCRK1-like [Telopea speciosissima]
MAKTMGHNEWVTELNVLGMVEHPNLVKLVGYCTENDERLLVYEYMPNRTVEDHLSPQSLTTLPWAMRLKIAQDAARGLTYLHEKMDFQIIFRDFKASNILLDDQWNAKLLAFGFACRGPSEGLSQVSMPVCENTLNGSIDDLIVLTEISEALNCGLSTYLIVSEIYGSVSPRQFGINSEQAVISMEIRMSFDE